MSDQEKKEQEILNQEMSNDEMETVAGGSDKVEGRKIGYCVMGAYANCDEKLSIEYGRPLYRPDGSVNCAATVED